jgi:hypothetical protein
MKKDINEGRSDQRKSPSVPETHEKELKELQELLNRAREYAKEAEKEAEELARFGVRDEVLAKKAMLVSKRFVELAAMLRPR